MHRIRDGEWRDVKEPSVKWYRGVLSSTLTYNPPLGHGEPIILKCIFNRVERSEGGCTFRLTEQDVARMIVPRII
jgi:hypothetical protein